MSNLMQLVYVSQATNFMSREDLDALSTQAAENNKSAGITGLLLYNSGHFMQLLEGHETIVYGLYQHVREDKRHRNVELLIFERADERLFPGWNMGVLNLERMGPLDKSRYTSLVDILTRYGDVFDARQRVKVLFSEFKQSIAGQSAAA